MDSTSSSGSTSIREAARPAEVEEARALFLEYRAWLVEHREVTAFGDEILARGLAHLDREIETLPGEYSPPDGALFLAYDGTTAFGCAAIHRQSEGVGEFKRLYVRDSHRGRGVGMQLTRRALERARTLGYRRVVLDTLPTMVGAIATYRKMGFRATER